MPIFARELDEDQPVKIENKNYFLRKGKQPMWFKADLKTMVRIPVCISRLLPPPWRKTLAWTSEIPTGGKVKHYFSNSFQLKAYFSVSWMVMPTDDMPTRTLPFQPAHETVSAKRYVYILNESLTLNLFSVCHNGRKSNSVKDVAHFQMDLRAQDERHSRFSWDHHKASRRLLH